MYRIIPSVLRCKAPLYHARNFSKVSPAATVSLNYTGSTKLESLSSAIRDFVSENAKICQPDSVHVCDGSQEENERLLTKLQQEGRLVKLNKLDNCYLATTTKEDVARVERQTYICSEKKEDAIPTPRPGVEPRLGYWKSPIEMDKEMNTNFTGCMKGRTMYVIPFSMGPVGSPLSKYGIQLTDSEYVVASMRIMTRMGQHVLDKLGDGEFVKCLHSVGYPLNEGKDKDVPWPCNPSKLAVAHYPERNEIKSFGSGYGGNSLLGKKCFALRIASILARREGWLAEHMLILGLTNPDGVKKYIAAAFPSQCGKTNLAMITPALPGWEAKCVGDDIAWMKFGPDGRLRAINPEYGFFGVAPGTNKDSNPNAMASITRDTVFTNVARTSDGGVYWEGLGDIPQGVNITSWLGKENWENLSPEERKRHPAAHPNSRFCSPASNCPSMDPAWEDPQGVPIDAILFGGRRPKTIPLVYEARDWEHAVFMGASMRSEATSAAENMGKQILHDPFAMRPFFGYSFAQYMDHWLSIGSRRDVTLPKVFHVNWFRKDENGRFLWPGFSENARVLEWIFNRCEGQDIACDSALGLIPTKGSLNIKGLKDMTQEKLDKLFDLPKDELELETQAIERFFDEQLPGQVPSQVINQLNLFKERVASL